MTIDNQSRKSKNAFMDSDLKFSDIVKRARLHESTAQYTLKQHAGGLPGMPKAGSQGLHRQFSVPQAMRLAIGTHMVMLGIPLRAAVKVVRFCEAQVRAAFVEQFDRPVTYQYGWSGSWGLEVFDGNLVRVVYSDVDETLGERNFYDISKGRVLKGLAIPNWLVRVELNLSELEDALMRRK